MDDVDDVDVVDRETKRDALNGSTDRGVERINCRLTSNLKLPTSNLFFTPHSAGDAWPAPAILVD